MLDLWNNLRRSLGLMCRLIVLGVVRRFFVTFRERVVGEIEGEEAETTISSGSRLVRPSPVAVRLRASTEAGETIFCALVRVSRVGEKDGKAVESRHHKPLRQGPGDDCLCLASGETLSLLLDDVPTSKKVSKSIVKSSSLLSSLDSSESSLTY